MPVHRLDGIVHTHVTKEQRRPLLNHLGVWIILVDVHMNSINRCPEQTVKIQSHAASVSAFLPNPKNLFQVGGCSAFCGGVSGASQSTLTLQREHRFSLTLATRR